MVSVSIFKIIVILQYYNFILVGITKKDSFTAEQNAIATLAKAIGHPARVAIIEYLTNVDSCICGDIVNELPLAQPTISQHLKELKSTGLIKGTIKGNTICYCIDQEAIDKILDYFSGISSLLTTPKNSCC